MKTEVRVRKIWPNTRSANNQVTVQFVQQGVTNTSNASNSLVALAQGVTASKGEVYALMSFNADEAVKYFGTTEIDYKNLPFEEWGSVEKLEEAAKGKLNISVVENTTKNPNSPNQQPKVNPGTAEVQTLNGEPIFRHTELVIGPAQVVLVQSDQQKARTSIPSAKVEEVKTFSLEAFGIKS